MKNLRLFFILSAAGLAWGQYSPVPSSSYPALDANINSKLAHREQAGVPTGNCIVGKDVATNTTNGDMYWCTATNTWTLKGAQGPPGSGGSGGSYTAGYGVQLVGTVFSIDTTVTPDRKIASQGIDSTCVVKTAVTGNAFVCVADGNVISTEANGMLIRFMNGATAASGSAMTLDVGSGVAKPVLQYDRTSNPTAAQVAANSINLLTYCQLCGGGSWILQTGPPSSGGGSSTVTDNSYTRHYTATKSGDNGGTGDGFIAAAGGAGCCNPSHPMGGTTTLYTLAISTGGATYVLWYGRIPEGWTGAIGFRSFWTLDAAQTGTGSHTYSVSCQTPGTFDQTLAPTTRPTFAGGVTVNFVFTGTDYTVGKIDAPVLVLPTCAVNDTVIIQMARDAGGTATQSQIVYFDVALPHTIQ